MSQFSTTLPRSESRACGWFAARPFAWIAGLLLCAASSGCQDKIDQPADRSTALDALVAACSEAMLRSSCTIMNGPQASASTTVVFVAGIGPVDATAYRELRNSGDAMCAVVRTACEKDWESAQCKTARGLWPLRGGTSTGLTR